MTPKRYHKLDSETILDQAATLSMREPVVLFKHSIMCGASHRARREMGLLTQDNDPPVYEVIVQDARPLSKKIEAAYGIRHQSPQVIVLYQRQPIFDASHGRVTAEAVRTAVETLSAS